MISKEELIINTIAFKEQIDQGQGQMTFLPLIQELGLTRMEVRREFLTSGMEELRQIKAEADRRQMALFYSVNEDLFVNGKPNPILSDLLAEAELLGAPFVKVNTGSANGVDAEALSTLRHLLSQSSIGLRVENNQSLENATIANCLKVMTLLTEASLPITFVFDTANWVFVGDQVPEAIQVMKGYSSYLHCKNYCMENSQPQVSSFYQGDIDLPALIEEFDQYDYLALEYPASFDRLKADVETLFA